MSQVSCVSRDVADATPRLSPSGAGDFKAALSSARHSREALGSLLDECRDSLQKLAENSLHNDVRPKVGASDVVQQTLLEASEGFAEFRGESREQLNAWIQRILVRNLLNELRKWRSTKMRSIGREVNLDALTVPLVTDDKTPSSVAVEHECEKLLRRAIERLSPDQQQAIRLRHCEQLGFDEIARRMNRQYSAARMLWYRAFEKLMHELGELRDEAK